MSYTRWFISIAHCQFHADKTIEQQNRRIKPMLKRIELLTLELY